MVGIWVFLLKSGKKSHAELREEKSERHGERNGWGCEEPRGEIKLGDSKHSLTDVLETHSALEIAQFLPRTLPLHLSVAALEHALQAKQSSCEPTAVYLIS